VAILVQQDPDDPSNSYVFWAIAAVLVVFAVVVVLARVV
jgi:hypothetical protein